MSSVASRRERRRFRALSKRERAQAMELPKLGVVATAQLMVDLRDDARERDNMAARAPRVAVQRQSPMDRYHDRGSISDTLYEAGNRLHGDFVLSGLNPWASKPDGGVYTGAVPTPGGGPRFAEYMQAMRAVGTTLNPVLAWVVCEGKSAESWAEHKERPARDGIAVLRVALDALAHHYGERSSLTSATARCSEFAMLA